MLDDLTAGALEDAENRKAERPLHVVESDAGKRPGARDVLAALAPADHVKIIAEVKRASPSKGHLAEITDPAALAVAYEAGGASAISVLTEGRRFRGSLSDLESVREAVSLPVLRKDFIASPYQVFEARAAGADFLLLIVSALDQAHLTSLFTLTEELGMTALVEVHDADQVGRALDIGAQLVGVNARDLTTFEVDQDLFGQLADQIPAGVIRVAESGVTSPADVVRYRDAGADVVLVGEALVTGDPIATLQRFLAV